MEKFTGVKSIMKPNKAMAALYHHMRSMKIPRINTKMQYIQEMNRLKRELHVKSRELLREVNKEDLYVARVQVP